MNNNGDIDKDQMALELKAIKAFNYKQYLRLTFVSTNLLKEDPYDKEKVIDVIRETLSFNYKQYKKLNFLLGKIEPKKQTVQKATTIKNKEGV